LGSQRIVDQIAALGTRLAEHSHLPEVAALIDGLAKAS
jgi:hypothetical protein